MQINSIDDRSEKNHMQTEKCPCCKKQIEYGLIQVSRDPQSEGVCYDCLPDDVQKAYDKFFGPSENVATKIDDRSGIVAVFLE